MDGMKDKLRKNEEELISLFSESEIFSEHLIKWEDGLLPDKYDQNFFEYSMQPAREEFEKALQYQKDKGAGFITFNDLMRVILVLKRSQLYQSTGLKA